MLAFFKRHPLVLIGSAGRDSLKDHLVHCVAPEWDAPFDRRLLAATTRDPSLSSEAMWCIAAVMLDDPQLVRMLLNLAPSCAPLPKWMAHFVSSSMSEPASSSAMHALIAVDDVREGYVAWCVQHVTAEPCAVGFLQAIWSHLPRGLWSQTSDSVLANPGVMQFMTLSMQAALWHLPQFTRQRVEGRHFLAVCSLAANPLCTDQARALLWALQAIAVEPGRDPPPPQHTWVAMLHHWRPYPGYCPDADAPPMRSSLGGWSCEGQCKVCQAAASYKLLASATDLTDCADHVVDPDHDLMALAATWHVRPAHVRPARPGDEAPPLTKLGPSFVGDVWEAARCGRRTYAPEELMHPVWGSPVPEHARASVRALDLWQDQWLYWLLTQHCPGPSGDFVADSATTATLDAWTEVYPRPVQALLAKVCRKIFKRVPDKTMHLLTTAMPRTIQVFWARIYAARVQWRAMRWATAALIIQAAYRRWQGPKRSKEGVTHGSVPTAELPSVLYVIGVHGAWDSAKCRALEGFVGLAPASIMNGMTGLMFTTREAAQTARATLRTASVAATHPRPCTHAPVPYPILVPP